MNIAVIGSGNIGTLVAAELSAAPENAVKVYTSRPEAWGRRVDVLDAQDRLLYRSGPIRAASNDLGEVMDGAEIVFVAVPSFMFQETADKMIPHIRTGMKVCAVPANGGAELYFKEISAGGVFFADLNECM